MNWFKRLCQRRNRVRLPDDWFWNSLQETLHPYFEEQRRLYGSPPEDDQFGHMIESILLLDDIRDMMREKGWVPQEPHDDRLQ